MKELVIMLYFDVHGFFHGANRGMLTDAIAKSNSKSPLLSILLHTICTERIEEMPFPSDPGDILKYLNKQNAV